MSFDFGSNDQTGGSSDPTADFLARERSAAGALGGDSDLFSHPHHQEVNNQNNEKDFAASAAAFPSLDGDDDVVAAGNGNAQIPSNQDNAGWGDDGDDQLGFTASSNQTINSSNNANEVGQFENKFPQLDDDEEEMDMGKANSSNNATLTSNGYMAPPVQSSMFTSVSGGNSHSTSTSSSNPLPTTTFSYSLNPTDNDSDPVAIQEWRSKQADNIAQRDATAERKKGEAISKAEEDIDRFYREYNEQKEKNIRKNK